MHFGAQSRGLRTPCERFAPWVTPGPRITRFRLVADLGRMGLDTHRVSNKVSKITSRHLVPLDRAFPAHALVHDSKLARGRPSPEASSPTTAVRLRSTTLGHLIQNVTCNRRLGRSPARRASAKTTPDDRFVPKEGIGAERCGQPRRGSRVVLQSGARHAPAHRHGSLARS